MNPIMINNPTCEDLRMIREGLGLSQEEFAEALGFKAETGARLIRRWEGDAKYAPTSSVWKCIKYLVLLYQVHIGEYEKREITQFLPEALR